MAAGNYHAALVCVVGSSGTKVLNYISLRTTEWELQTKKKSHGELRHIRRLNSSIAAPSKSNITYIIN